MNKLEFYLVSTDHFSDRLWFRDDADFKAGMNYVAVVAAASGVRVLAFILMSNHVHFVLAGSREDVVAFIHEFKRRYSMYYQRKYGMQEFLRDNGVDIRPVGLEEESLERAIAYVQMNSVAANICVHATQYPWGTGPVFFRAGNPEGRPLGELSRRAQARILYSNTRLPGTFQLAPGGYIDPVSYVNVELVERLYRTPGRFEFFLRNSSKARLRLQEKAMPSFRDQSILAVVPDLCRTLFRKDAVADLSREQRGEMLRQLRFRFSADVAQLARILGLPYEEAVRLIDE